MIRCDVAILGAGPYGLSAAAHLRAVKGLDVYSFGDPMSFWTQKMPEGMLLRSGWAASHIASPDQSLTLESFQAASASSFGTPVPLDRFVEYGKWYQSQAVPHLDSRKILRIERYAGSYRLISETGENILARRVVVAAGISSFTWRPPEFDNIPATLASHTSEHRGFRDFAGKQVLVIGSGQSALESAALLHESGAEVEVVARKEKIRWLGGVVSRTIQKGLGPHLAKILYAPTDVGPAGISQLVARPHMVRCLPRGVQDWLRKKSIRPAGARWLVERLNRVPMTLGRSVVDAMPCGDRIKIKLDDGHTGTFDHVFLGTGYRIDVTKYDFLAPELAQAIERFGGFPILGKGFETSIPGLHILGAPSIWSFGPLMQFVVGTHYASQELSRCIATKAVRRHPQVASKLAAEVG